MTDNTAIKIHPASTLFPMMDDRELMELTKDIKANGVRNPLVFLGDELLDGRNRLKAMCKAGLNPHDHKVVKTAEEIGDPVSFVWSLNGPRRHLNQSQLAMVADKMAKLKQGKKSNTAMAVSQSQSDAAKAVGVSVDSVQRARKVHDKAVPEIVDAVEKGELSVRAASTVAELPKSQQKKLAAKGTKAVKDAAAKKRSRSAPKADKSAVSSDTNKDDTAPSSERQSQFNPADFDPAMKTSEPSTDDGRKKFDALVLKMVSKVDAIVADHGPLIRGCDDANRVSKLSNHRYLIDQLRALGDQLTEVKKTMSAMQRGWDKTKGV